MKIIFYIFLIFLSACGEGTEISVLNQDQINAGIPTTVNTGQGSDQKYMKIASFNIAELGNPDMNKDFKAIAKMVDGFDLIALQEVQDVGGTEAVKKIHAELNAIAASPYHLPLVIPGAGRGHPGNEGYAFIYRDPVRLDDRFSPAYDFRYDKKDHTIYSRVPAFAYFRADRFDFVVATVHLVWGDIIRRKKEVTDIKKWLIEYANRGAAEERDLIIVGDFNRYGDGQPQDNLTDAVIERHSAPFDVLVDANEIAKTYRLIFLEFLKTLNTRFASLDAQSTTTGTEGNLYDQIMISAGAFREYDTIRSIFNENIGVVAFDMESPWKEKDHVAIKAAVSDHRPIWARFRTDLGDDDG